MIPKPRLVVNTSLVCDANNLTFRRAAEHYGIPQQYIDVPYDRTEESVEYVAGQLRQLAELLEEITARKLDMEALKAAAARSCRTVELFRSARGQRGANTWTMI